MKLKKNILLLLLTISCCQTNAAYLAIIDLRPIYKDNSLAESEGGEIENPEEYKSYSWSEYLYNKSTSCYDNKYELNEKSSLRFCKNLKMGQLDKSFPTEIMNVEKLGIVDISKNNFLDLSFLSKVEQMTSLNISDNKINSLSGLESVKIINGSLVIDNINDITDLNGLTNLSKLGSLELKNNEYFNNFYGISKIRYLTSSYGGLILENLPNIENFEELNITDIAGDLILSGDLGLSNLKGLNKISTVGTLKVTKTKKIDNLNELNGLRYITEGKSLEISYNNDLKNISGLSNISSKNNSIRIFDNKGLNIFPTLKTDVISFISVIDNSGLIDLSLKTTKPNTIIKGKIEIIRNKDLKEISGLLTVTDIRGLQVYGNENLKSLNGLSNLKTIGCGKEAYGLNTKVVAELNDYKWLSKVSSCVGSDSSIVLINSHANKSMFPTKESAWCKNKMYYNVSGSLGELAKEACR